MSGRLNFKNVTDLPIAMREVGLRAGHDSEPKLCVHNPLRTPEPSQATLPYTSSPRISPPTLVKFLTASRGETSSLARAVAELPLTRRHRAGFVVGLYPSLRLGIAMRNAMSRCLDEFTPVQVRTCGVRPVKPI